MTLDAALQRLYASAPDGQRAREGITLSHPAFTKQWHLTTERVQWSGDDGDGNTLLYLPGPIAVTPQGQDESGRGQMPIRIAALPEVCAELVAAATLSSTPLTLTVRTYLVGEVSPRNVVTLELTGVRVEPDAGVISGVAAMPLLDGMAVGRLLYRTDRWPGLDRA